MSIFLDNWLLSRAHRVYCPIDGSTARSFGAGHLFDEMSIWRSTKRQSMETAVAGHEDRISTLPDELLQYMMSFLLSRDAVRTCVLAKRWRALWKSVPALRIGDIESYHSVHSFSRFVDELLRLRDPAPMHECEIRSNYMQNNDEVFQSMLLSIQYALSCQVQVLRVSFRSHAENMTFVSSHLKSLKLCHIWFWDCSIDFSRCQVLEELEMENCGIFENIFSPSLRHLNINGGCTQSGSRTRISTPHLIGLKLGDFWGLTPLLDRMPSLVTASITLGKDCRDLCYIYCGGNPKCTGCNGHPGNSNCSVVLEGLSGATNLELTASHPNVFMFRNDLKWCPMFSKLKTLFLSDWCVVDDFIGLVSFLQHSPILETLTLDLHFGYPEHVMETDERCNQKEQPLLLKHLKVVKIICQVKEDARFHRILKILRIHGVPSKQINIQ